MKAIVTIQVEVDISPHKNDDGLSTHEIAENAAGALCLIIRDNSSRQPEIQCCTVEYSEKFSVDY